MRRLTSPPGCCFVRFKVSGSKFKLSALAFLPRAMSHFRSLHALRLIGGDARRSFSLSSVARSVNSSASWSRFTLSPLLTFSLTLFFLLRWRVVIVHVLAAGAVRQRRVLSRKIVLLSHRRASSFPRGGPLRHSQFHRSSREWLSACASLDARERSVRFVRKRLYRRVLSRHSARVPVLSHCPERFRGCRAIARKRSG